MNAWITIVIAVAWMAGVTSFRPPLWLDQLGSALIILLLVAAMSRWPRGFWYGFFWKDRR